MFCLRIYCNIVLQVRILKNTFRTKMWAEIEKLEAVRQVSYKDTCILLSEACFHLRKWMSTWRLCLLYLGTLEDNESGVQLNISVLCRCIKDIKQNETEWSAIFSL